MLAAARRPSLCFIAALWTGLLSGGSVGLDLTLVVGIQAWLTVFLVLTARPRLRFALLVTSFFVLGVLRSPESYWNLIKVPAEVQAELKSPVIARVEVPPLIGECSERVRARVCRVVVGYPGIAGKHVFLTGLDEIQRPGVREFTAIGSFRLSRGRLNPFAADRLRQNLRQGVIGNIHVETVVDEGGDHSYPGALSLRRRLGDLIRDCSDRSTRGMLEALLLGKRSDLSPLLQTLMIKAGTYHVLAISGLHVGIVVLVLMSFLSVLRLGRSTRIVVSVACVLCYVVFTGARPSAQRAWTFFMLISLCKLLQWKTDYPNCTCAAGVILLLAFPHLAWDVGFRLSLGAVFGITLMVPQLAGGSLPGASIHDKVKRYIVLGLAASVSAQAFTLPIVLYHFGRVSLIGPIANLVLLPLVTLIVAAGLETTIAMPFCLSLARVFMRSASSLVSVLIATASILTGLVNPLVVTGRPGILRIVVYSGLLAYLSLGRPHMKKKVKILLLLSLCAFLIVPLPEDSGRVLKVTFLYVGDGDAAVLEMPNGKVILVDAGACGDTFDAAHTYIVPFLAMSGRKRIDTVIITHPHNDHYGGLATLAEAVEIGEVLVSTRHGERQYEVLLDELAIRGLPVKLVRSGDRWHCGDVLVDVLHPQDEKPAEPIDDPNALSVVFRLTYRELSFLFTGDVTPVVQRDLLQNGYDVSCDILKVPHHGAPGALDSAFTKGLGARFAVISVGTRFSSHPSPHTIRLLEDSHIRTFSTITDGAVSVVSDGESTTITSELTGLTAIF